MPKSVTVALAANESRTITNSGLFVFCRSATGSFTVELNESGELMKMIAGDKITSNRPITAIRLVDTSGAGNVVELVAGSGGFYVAG